MRRNIKIILLSIIIILLLATVSFYILTNSYKTIKLNGYEFEVPSNDNTVQNISDNYLKYTDNENNIKVKSYAIKQ